MSADLKTPWTVDDTEDWGLTIINNEDGCVAFFAYPGDNPDRRSYNEAQQNAEAICAAVNAFAAFDLKT